jgi:hypothetical protein
MNTRVYLPLIAAIFLPAVPCAERIASAAEFVGKPSIPSAPAKKKADSAVTVPIEKLKDEAFPELE